jgi:oligopeptide transport system permease protein
VNNQSKSWKKFSENKLALAGLLFIIFISLTAIMGYLITPDDSPMADRMNLSLSIKKPGTQVTFLCIPVNGKKENFLQKIFFGEPLQPNLIPITSYNLSGDRITYKEYTGDNESSVISYLKLTSFGPTLSDREFKEKYILQKTFWLGTDVYGRDMLSRIIIGARMSLMVGFMALLLSLGLGLIMGALAGYYGGYTDVFISWFMNVLWALPALLLVIAISFALGKGVWQVFIAIGLSLWIEVARLVRGQFISMRNAQFVEAAKALGYGNLRIIFKHILPNILGPITVIAASNFASAILLEAGLSFLGFGAQPPTPTWGGMIKEHYGYIIMDAAYLALIPGLLIMLVVYAFNLITLGLRDLYNIRSQNSNV